MLLSVWLSFGCLFRCVGRSLLIVLNLQLVTLKEIFKNINVNFGVWWSYWINRVLFKL